MNDPGAIEAEAITRFRRFVTRHGLMLRAAQEMLFQGIVPIDNLSALRWFAGRLDHERRLDGSCERHCARCALDRDPVMCRAKESRSASAEAA